MGMKLKDMPLHPDNDFTKEELELRDAFCDFMQPVADWLKAGAPHVVAKDLLNADNGSNTTKTGFCMASVFSHEDDYEVDFSGEECGATMCMLGAAAQFNSNILIKALVANVQTENSYLRVRPLRKFGPWNDRARALFFEQVEENVTPGRALEALIETVTRGYPYWD